MNGLDEHPAPDAVLTASAIHTLTGTIVAPGFKQSVLKQESVVAYGDSYIDMIEQQCFNLVESMNTYLDGATGTCGATSKEIGEVKQGLREGMDAMVGAYRDAWIAGEPIEEPIVVDPSVDFELFPHIDEPRARLGKKPRACDVVDEGMETTVRVLMRAVQESIDMLLRNQHPVVDEIAWDELDQFRGKTFNERSRTRTFSIRTVVDVGLRTYPIPMFRIVWDTDEMDLLSPVYLDGVPDDAVPELARLGDSPEEFLARDW